MCHCRSVSPDRAAVERPLTGERRGAAGGGGEGGVGTLADRGVGGCSGHGEGVDGQRGAIGHPVRRSADHDTISAGVGRADRADAVDCARPWSTDM